MDRLGIDDSRSLFAAPDRRGARRNGRGLGAWAALRIACAALFLFCFDVARAQVAMEHSPKSAEAADKEALTGKAVALLRNSLRDIQALRLPENRIRAQARAADLLWTYDEPRARDLFAEAAAGLNEYLSSIDKEDESYQRIYQVAWQLRIEVLQQLAGRDPEMALNLLRSSRHLASPYADPRDPEQNPEYYLELTLATQIAAAAPERALKLARESLSKGFRPELTGLLSQLRAKDDAAAAALATEINVKLQSADLLKNPQAALLALNLLQLGRTPDQASDGPSSASAGKPLRPLLGEQAYRDLMGRTLSAALRFSPASSDPDSQERETAANILNTLQPMMDSVQKYAPDLAPRVEKTAALLNQPPDRQEQIFQRYQEIINRESPDAALVALEQAPPELRENLYQQVAWKMSTNGDSERAQGILMEHISNPSMRRQMIETIERQSADHAIQQGKIDDARMRISHLRSSQTRAVALIQLGQQAMGKGNKKAAEALLDEARGILPAGRAEGQEQFSPLVELAHAYVRVNPAHSFEMIEPLIDQFNELSGAATVLNGFPQQFFQDGELMTQNGNALGGLLMQLANVAENLAPVDFDRARAAADRLQRPDARVWMYLSIVQGVLNGPRIVVRSAPIRAL